MDNHGQLLSQVIQPHIAKIDVVDIDVIVYAEIIVIQAIDALFRYINLVNSRWR